MARVSGGRAARGARQARHASHATAQLCHTFARSRSGPAHDSDSVRARQTRTHSGLPASFSASSADGDESAGKFASLQSRRRKALTKAAEEMTRPPFEVADIIRAEGQSFIDKNRSWLNGGHLKVLAAIERCRTAALGGHRDQCAKCGYQAISYNSCRNRHCPKCQTNAREKWLAKRSADLLPVPYVHVVFTLPHLLAPLAYHNKKLLYDLLFRASAETLIEVSANPKRLGAELGFLSVLHTWGQTLQHHPHVHCVIPAGGLSPDHQRWIHARPDFFLPVGVLRKVFRGKFTDGLKRLWREKLLCLPGSLNVLQQEKTFRTFLRSLHRKKWAENSKPPMCGPKHVLQYLARYTHRASIYNPRI